MYDSEGSKPGHDDEVAGEHTRPAASSSRQTLEGKNKTIEIPGYQSALERHEAELQHRTRKLDGTIQPVGSSSGSSMHLVTSPSSLEPGQTGLPPPHTPDYSRSGPRILIPGSLISDEAMEPVRASISSLIERAKIAFEHASFEINALRTLDREREHNAKTTLDSDEGDAQTGLPRPHAPDHPRSVPRSLRAEEHEEPARVSISSILERAKIALEDADRETNALRTLNEEGEHNAETTLKLDDSEVVVAKEPAHNHDTSGPPQASDMHGEDKQQTPTVERQLRTKHDPTSPSTTRSTRRSSRNKTGASPTSAPTAEPTAQSRRIRRMAKKKGKKTEAGQLGVDPDA
jgi:hypothetical protein